MGEKEHFDSWAIVELFGHQKIAGRVTEATVGGCSFLRVDVPGLPEGEATRWGHERPATVPFTRYFGNGAIYAMTPCTQEVAMATAQAIRVTPPIAFDVPELRQKSLTGPGYDDGDDIDPDQP